ncbi:Cysteine-rich secretory protein LCCL domain-containing 1 [Paramecium bursaria]
MIIFLLSSVLALTQYESCDTTVKGIVASKVAAFEEAFNRLRNEVSQGRRANHKGEIEYAANMYLARWSKGIASGAQNCAEKCPDSLHTCRNLKQNYGALSTFATTHSSAIDYSPKEIFNKWMMKREPAEQLVVGHLMQFGCGRALKKNLGKFVEYVVCFFDLPPRPGQAPYVVASEKTIASACKLGRSSTYSGLCVGTFGDILLMFKELKYVENKIIESLDE